jgi:class 3 adenylate cyclase
MTDGFTTLTERLAVRGKAGAEEMADLLNATFEQLLTAAYDYGANLLKWGGDAVLLLFDGAGHAVRAARAGWAMQEVMRRIDRLPTSRDAYRANDANSTCPRAADEHSALRLDSVPPR